MILENITDMIIYSTTRSDTMLEKLRAVSLRYEELCAKAEQPELYADPKKAAALMREKNDLEPTVEPRS